MALVRQPKTAGFRPNFQVRYIHKLATKTARATVLAELCNTIPCQPIEQGNCSNCAAFRLQLGQLVVQEVE